MQPSLFKVVGTVKAPSSLRMMAKINFENGKQECF
jgi:hypothetical protein